MSRQIPSSAGGGVAGLDTDGDNDSRGEGPPYDGDNDAVPTFGLVADASDRRAILSLIRGYYAAAAAGDGAAACSMLYFLTVETVVAEYERGRRALVPRGAGACARGLSRLFERRHHELLEYVGVPQAAVVRVKGNRGLAVVRFGAVRELLIWVQREGDVWKMDAPLDIEAP